MNAPEVSLSSSFSSSSNSTFLIPDLKAESVSRERQFKVGFGKKMGGKFFGGLDKLAARRVQEAKLGGQKTRHDDVAYETLGGRRRKRRGLI